MQLSDINGIYNLGPKEINGYPHWIHENGKQAMWFNKISASWFVGDTEDVGDNMGGISGNNFVYIASHGLAEDADKVEESVLNA